MTTASAKALAGLGLMGVAKDNYPRDGVTYGFVMGFAESKSTSKPAASVSSSTLGVTDSGTVDQSAQHPLPDSGRQQPRNRPRADAEVGLRPALRRAAGETLHQTKPMTILDMPVDGMHGEALGIPTQRRRSAPRASANRRSGAAYAAVMNAIADAVGVDVFRRAPVTPDIVLMSLEAGKRMHDPLTAHV